jgi:hypothetical protein
MAIAKKKDQIKKRVRVHEELFGFDIKINAFGELSSNVSIDKLNLFLNKNLEDKKLKA